MQNKFTYVNSFWYIIKWNSKIKYICSLKYDLLDNIELGIQNLSNYRELFAQMLALWVWIPLGDQDALSTFETNRCFRRLLPSSPDFSLLLWDIGPVFKDKWFLLMFMLRRFLRKRNSCGLISWIWWTRDPVIGFSLENSQFCPYTTAAFNSFISNAGVLELNMGERDLLISVMLGVK